MSLEMSTSGSSSSEKKFRMNDGDWICSDAQCGNVNFARRATCNRCGKEKSTIPQRKKLGHEIGKAAAEKSRGLFSADDWQCGRCGNVNWARRQQCNMCNAPKYGEVEERTGLGGGYNERENIEYIEREESDGEYDDFGRKKKKFRNVNSKSESNHVKSQRKSEVAAKPEKPIKSEKISKIESEEVKGDDEEDDEDEEDLSKYDLSGWGDDHDSKPKKKSNDDDEDEEDEDVSKYELSGWDNETPKKKANKEANSVSHSRSSSSSESHSRSSSSDSSSSRSRSSSPSRSQSRSTTPDHSPTKGTKRKNSRSRSGSYDSRYRRRHHRSQSSSQSPPTHRSGSQDSERSVSKSPEYRKR